MNHNDDGVLIAESVNDGVDEFAGSKPGPGTGLEDGGAPP